MVHDNVYQNLVMRHRNGERGLSTGKEDGTTRPIKRMADGRFVEKGTQSKVQIIPMKMVFVMNGNYSVIGRQSKYATWNFVRWLYDKEYKIIGKRFRAPEGHCEDFYFEKQPERPTKKRKRKPNRGYRR